MPPTSFVLQWLVTSVILAVVLYVLAESGQRYLYDAVIERLVWRVLAIAPILAAILVKWPLSLESFLNNIFALAVQSVVWFIACWLGLRFQWPHAAVAAPLTVFFAGAITSATVQHFFREEPAPSQTGFESRGDQQSPNLVQHSGPARLKAHGSLFFEQRFHAARMPFSRGLGMRMSSRTGPSAPLELPESLCGPRQPAITRVV